MAANVPVVRIISDDITFSNEKSLMFESVGWVVNSYLDVGEFLSSNFGLKRPGCIVWDISKIDRRDIYLPRNRKGTYLPVICWDSNGDIPKVVQMMKLGAFDFLTNQTSSESFINAVREAIDNSLSMLSQSNELTEIRRKLETLTIREREVIDLVCLGMTSKEIAKKTWTFVQNN